VAVSVMGGREYGRSVGGVKVEVQIGNIEVEIALTPISPYVSSSKNPVEEPLSLLQRPVPDGGPFPIQGYATERPGDLRMEVDTLSESPRWMSDITIVAYATAPI